ncbi:MAG: deoxyribose-phosphate aldolase [Coraliomargaritaceae bacterium]
MKTSKIAPHIESTNLKLDSTDAELCALCDEAAELGFAAVCIYPANVNICSNILYNTPVQVATVISFPHGRSSLAAKRAEVLEAREQGASEVDLVINYNNLRVGEKGLAADEAATLCEVAREVGLVTKIVIEAGELKKKQKLHALSICEQAKADFIQTATGFGSSETELEDVDLFHKKRSKKIKIKAIGRIQNMDHALQIIEAGASRLGISQASRFLREAKKQAN